MANVYFLLSGMGSFLKSQYPDMVDCLSTAKSPQQMQGAIIKNYFADKIHEDPENIFKQNVHFLQWTALEPVRMLMLY